MKQLLRNFKKNNQGVSLITVIITVMFLAVLGTILISATLVNYQMKQLDQRGKKDFYTAENVLDDVYNGLGKNVTLIIGDSYDQALTMNNSGGGSSTGRFASEEEAFRYLKKEFVKQFQTYYGIGEPGNPFSATNPINSDANKETLRAAITQYIVPIANGTGSVESIGNIKVDSNFNYIALEEVVATFENTEMDMVSSITTDIVLRVPTLRFFDDHDYVWDYAVIGNKGVYITDAGSASPASTVRGNLFAGTGDAGDLRAAYGQRKIPGGLNILNTKCELFGETIISEGDVNLKHSALYINGLSSNQKSNFWASTVNLAKDGSNGNILQTNGNVFLDNDLEVNCNNGSIDLNGNYYGYNNNYVTKESAVDNREHAKSSSIIVNGRKNTLDMKGLDILLLAGRSYMDFDTANVQSESGEKEYGTGEALSLRTSQVIYLVPTEFLPYANPEKKRPDMHSITDFDESEMYKSEWFGSRYLHPVKPVSEQVIKINGEEFMYYFLNFKTEADRNAYVSEILHATSSDTTEFGRQAYEIKHRMGERAQAMLQNDLIIDSRGEECGVYSNFEVMEYDKVANAVVATKRAENNFIETNIYAQALTSRYTYIKDTLDPKKELPLDSVIVYTSPGTEELPLSDIVKMIPDTDYVDLITRYGNCGLDGMPGGLGCFRKTVTGTTYDVMITNSDINMSGQTFNGIILSMGDVTLNHCTVNGIVLAAGDVTLKESTVNANREIVMSIIEAESQEIDGLSIASTDMEHKTYFVHYLTDPRYNGEFAYGKDAIGTDYTEFMTYENWKKGDVR